MKTEARFDQPDEAENTQTAGINANVILSRDCRGGKLTIIEQEFGVGIASQQLSRRNEDKVIYISEGKFVLLAEGYKYLATKGASLFIPQGVNHQFKNVGTNTGKLLVTITPGGHRDISLGANQTVRVFEQKPL